MSGDRIQQYGAGSIGKAEHSGSGDIVAGGKGADGSPSQEQAIDNLLREVQTLRRRLDENDRAEVDAAVREIRSNPSGERFKKLIQKIAGIAVVIGEAGIPVVIAAKTLLGFS
jgi:hypothetical protein